MNAVEIEEAVSLLAEHPFQADAFPYAFLEAFGNKATTIKRLKSGATNKSDVGGVLQRGNIHLMTCGEGEVAATLDALRNSPATAKQKARFILATDGSEFQAEDIEGGETVACNFPDFANHFGFFLELAGISTVRAIKENAFDIKATSRLNRLYVELLKDNPEWGTEARRHEMNHFMARLIFCFFAEDTDIFHGSGLFTATVEQMSERDASNTHEIIAELFRAMNTKIEDRAAGHFRPWADVFPYVNGGLFAGVQKPGAPPPPSVSRCEDANRSVRAPVEPYWHTRGYLPHFEDPTKLQHITFRLADSLPKDKLDQLDEELKALPEEGRAQARREKIDQWLAAGLGCCALAHAEVAQIVTECLQHRNGEDYQLIAWCVMPNHVHVLIKPEITLGEIIQAWKSVTARKVLALNDSLELGIPDAKQLWQKDYWDRYMRDSEHLDACVCYIHENPVKAKLVQDAKAWKWSSAGATSPSSADLDKCADEGIRAPSVPKFSKIARSYLLHVGKLDWTKINPDIFGSMIQAVADDAERGALGMHYTSVPNILKVLNPLFLDDLRAKLEEAGDNARKLLNLRNRIARIRVFDPACGSGNFLVIAYKEMRVIEAEINQRRGERDRRTDLPLTNFRGIEIRDFSAEIARLALIIAEYQCDVMYRGQKEALAEFLPLEKANWITCGNALRLDWLSICPPTGSAVKHLADDLFATPLDQAEIDFRNEGGETYICGNPPYLGSTWQTPEQKSELKGIFEGKTKSWKSLDYVAGWFMKAAQYGTQTEAAAAFVSTNSICQGQQVPILWPVIFATGHQIQFAHTSFKWANLASHNAGVTVVIIGLGARTPPSASSMKRLFSLSDEKQTISREVNFINAYLVAAPSVIIEKASKPLCGQAQMSFGNKPVDGGHLLLTADEVEALGLTPEQRQRFIRRIYGSAEFIRGMERFVLWIEDRHLKEAESIPAIRERIEGVRMMRLSSRDKSANEMAKSAHQMREMNIGASHTIAVPAITSENREFLPCGLLNNETSVTNKVYALYDAPLWNMALIASRLHWVWIGTVCVRMRTDFSYSNTLGWNTFPVPKLTESNKADLTRCAEDILLAREAHFPATIADLYKNADGDVGAPGMPENLRTAHERNDEVLERIYIGRRFKNDTERLEKLFELYTKMTTEKEGSKK